MLPVLRDSASNNVQNEKDSRCRNELFSQITVDGRRLMGFEFE